MDPRKVLLLCMASVVLLGTVNADFSDHLLDFLEDDMQDQSLIEMYAGDDASLSMRHSHVLGKPKGRRAGLRSRIAKLKEQRDNLTNKIKRRQDKSESADKAFKSAVRVRKARLLKTVNSLKDKKQRGEVRMRGMNAQLKTLKDRERQRRKEKAGIQKLKRRRNGVLNRLAVLRRTLQVRIRKLSATIGNLRGHVQTLSEYDFRRRNRVKNRAKRVKRRLKAARKNAKRIALRITRQQGLTRSCKGLRVVLNRKRQRLKSAKEKLKRQKSRRKKLTESITEIINKREKAKKRLTRVTSLKTISKLEKYVSDSKGLERKEKERLKVLKEAIKLTKEKVKNFLAARRALDKDIEKCLRSPPLGTNLLKSEAKRLKYRIGELARRFFGLKKLAAKLNGRHRDLRDSAIQIRKLVKRCSALDVADVALKRRAARATGKQKEICRQKRDVLNSNMDGCLSQEQKWVQVTKKLLRRHGLAISYPIRERKRTAPLKQCTAKRVRSRKWNRRRATLKLNLAKVKKSIAYVRKCIRKEKKRKEQGKNIRIAKMEKYGKREGVARKLLNSIRNDLATASKKAFDASQDLRRCRTRFRSKGGRKSARKEARKILRQDSKKERDSATVVTPKPKGKPKVPVPSKVNPKTAGNKQPANGPSINLNAKPTPVKPASKTVKPAVKKAPQPVKKAAQPAGTGAAKAGKATAPTKPTTDKPRFQESDPDSMPWF